MTFDPMRQQPSEVVCYMNSKCNAACSFCLRQKAGYAPTPDLSADTLRVVLDAYPRIGSACLAGFGEPLLAKTLPEVLELCEAHNVYSGIITNGSLIDSVSDDVPFSLAGHVTISINAWDEKSHAEAFGLKNMYDRVAAGVETLRSEGVLTLGAFVVGKQTVDKLPEMMGYAADLGITNVYAVNELFHGDHSDSEAVQKWVRENVITIHDQDAIHQIGVAQNEAQALGINISVLPQPIDPDSNPRLCLSPFSRIGVDGSGDITGCLRVIPPNRTTGNILEEGPLVWATSAHLQRLRDGLDRSGPLAPECRYCFGAWIKG